MPEIEPTVPTAVLLLLQVPPLITSDNVLVPPIVALAVPKIGPGIFTVTVVVAFVPQPVL